MQSATRPDWVNIYLADSLGQSRGSGAVLITSVENGENPIIPQSEILLGNYPNPFNPSTTIKFTIPEESQVRIFVYNSLGKEIDSILEGIMQQGFYEKSWNAERFSSGIYYLKMNAESITSGKIFSDVIKMILLK